MRHLLCLLSVPYLDQEEIKLCEKFIYSYSTRLAFLKPGSYHLTIFNYSIVVATLGELSPIYFKDLKGEILTSIILGEILPATFGSCTWISIRLYDRLEASVALSFKLIRLVCLLLFAFVLVLGFCSAEHAFEFRFAASSLAIVFVSTLNCVCLHILV